MRKPPPSAALPCALLSGVAFALAAGCGQPGPSYQQLLQNYNQEAQRLKDLKAERARVIAECEQAVYAKADELMTSIRLMERTANSTAAVDPAAAAEMRQITLRSLESVEQSIKTFTELRVTERDDKLQTIDRQIAEQAARVDEARIKRDAADPDR